MDPVLRPQLFYYDSYRVFLNDYKDFLRVKTGQSVKDITQETGYRSPNYLSLIIEGKRNLSENKIDRLSEVLKLSFPESRFFKHLVLFEQAKEVRERRYHIRELTGIKAFSNACPNKVQEIHYYSKWFYITVRELIALNDFEENPFWISRKLRGAITPEEAREALDGLLTINMIRRDENGRLRQAQKTVVPDNKIAISALIDFHQTMIGKASQALETMTAKERDISCVTIPLSRDAFDQIKNLITQFRRSLLEISANCADPDILTQVNLQMFPLTGESRGQNDE